MKLSQKRIEVSVILTIFNSRQFYKRALNSVLNQSFKDFEIIIADDGSTDEIEKELFAILKKFDFIKYVRHSNRKHPLTLNTGIMISSGNFLSFIDSDDEYEKDYLKRRIDFFRNNPQADLIYSPATIIGDEKDFFVPDAKDHSKLIHLDDCIIGGTFFGKRNIFTELNGFNNIYSHDSDFFERASGSYCVIRFDSRDYVYHRDNPESVISRLKLSQMRNDT